LVLWRLSGISVRLLDQGEARPNGNAAVNNARNLNEEIESWARG
jgi:hypothetical protein